MLTQVEPEAPASVALTDNEIVLLDQLAGDLRNR